MCRKMYVHLMITKERIVKVLEVGWNINSKLEILW
jgi:hypothetical protein